jgi:OOP family OmpA-OmpF porin
MKKLLSFIFLFVASTSLQSQTLDQGIGVHFSGLDFYGAQTGNYFLQDKFSENSATSTKRLFWEPAIGVSYWHTLNKHFDVYADLHSSIMQYPLSDKDSSYIKLKNGTSTQPKNENLYVYSSAKVHYNILPKENYFFAPYIAAGLAIGYRKEKTGFYVPVGLGVHIPVANGVFVNLASHYQVPLGNAVVPNIIHSAGFVYWWSRSKKVKPVTPKPVEIILPKDTDNDGVVDTEDGCPTIPGRKEMLGCPDKDNDGVADKEDRCPEVAGLRSLSGCPDKDKDGIEDSKDACPDVAGLLKYNGCPTPDTDKDGFNDEVDKCPQVASSVNEGCPEIKLEDKKKIEMAAQGVNFETGSAILSKASFANLDKIAAILKAEPTYLVDIEGHTDNVGNAEKNVTLSQKRADACKEYLMKAGIDAARISSVGYGDMKPIESNDTKSGRAKNRRTEFNIKSF